MTWKHWGRKVSYSITFLLTTSVPPIPLVLAQSERCVEKVSAPPSEAPVGLWCVVDGKKTYFHTDSRKVADALADAGVVLGPLDRVVPAATSPTATGMVIRVVRVKRQMVKQPVKIPFQTVCHFNRNLRPGTRRTIQEGREGTGIKVLEVWTKDGVITKQTVLETHVVTEPVNRVLVLGDRSLGTSRGGIRVHKVLVMEATGYSPSRRECGRYATGYTATGLRAGYGVVAVDPRVIPLGTRLFIEGYGHAVAADVGGAIKGLRIDLGHDTYLRALQVGRRTVRVYVLN